MRILSVISLKTYERYGYTFLREIFLRKVDYNQYKISEADFKNLHPNDFEDLYLLHLQGQLNHLSGADKVHLFNAVNLIAVIMEYLVKVSKRRTFWSLNEDILKITILKTNTLEDSIRRIQDIVCEYSGRYQEWSLL
ncbi:hypothetical protein Tco_0159954 [Tanacetum coccineum]